MSSREKQKLLLFGGTGGLGDKLVDELEWDYWVTPVGSQAVNVRFRDEVDDIIEQYSPDIVVNLAGTNYDSFLHKLTEDTIEVDDVVDVNVLGAVHIMSSALNHMRPKGYGRIIMASSVLAEKVQVGTGLYSATKCFVDSLVRTASAENIGKGITVNSLRMGYFDGGMCHRIPEKFQEGIKENIGLHRWGNIKELAQTIDYLVRTEYITGQNINISGGLL